MWRSNISIPLAGFKKTDQIVHIWSDYLNIYPHNFEKTHSGNFFLLVAEDVVVWILRVEDAAFVLDDGAK